MPHHAATPRRGYWGLSGVGGIGDWGFFYSAPQDFVVLGVFCARFPPREAGPGGSTEIGPETDGAPGLWAFKLISFLE